MADLISLEKSILELTSGVNNAKGHLWKLMRVNLATPLAAFFCPKASPYVKYGCVFGLQTAPKSVALLPAPSFQRSP
jgi:hypothetical protein